LYGKYIEQFGGIARRILEKFLEAVRGMESATVGPSNRAVRNREEHGWTSQPWRIEHL
jgi:hypothetical protein